MFEKSGPAFVFGALAAILASSAAAQSVAAIPDPADGRWAATTVALLQHSQDRCSGVGDRVVTFWSRQSGDSEAVRQAVDNYMWTRATSDIAGARKALDIAHSFIPRASTEIDPSQSALLGRLHEVDTELCNVIAQPTPPRQDFEAAFEQARNQAAQVEEQVGRLINLPEPKELVKALQPYLDAIETAAGVAQEEVRRDLDSRRAKPKPPPTDTELMAAWHQGYAEAVLPAKLALKGYLDGRRKSDGGAINKACKDLLDVVIPLLSQDEVFRAPDPEVEEPLRAIYKAMRRLGGHCTAGRFTDADEAYDWLQQNLGRAAELLAPYALRP